MFFGSELEKAYASHMSVSFSQKTVRGGRLFYSEPSFSLYFWSKYCAIFSLHNDLIHFQLATDYFITSNNVVGYVIHKMAAVFPARTVITKT